MFLLRVKAIKLGNHTHCTFWTGFGERMPEPLYSHLGQNGELVFRNDEWNVFKRMLKSSGEKIIIIQEENGDRPRSEDSVRGGELE